MGVETFKGVVKSKGGVRAEGDSRGFKVLFDEPKEMGGTNEGMNPVEMQLNTLGACQVITAKVHAPRFGVEIEDMWVELEGDVDLRGFEGVPGVFSGFSEIRFVMHMVTESSEEQVMELVSEVENLCPIGNSLQTNIKLKETGVVIEKTVLS